MWGEGTMQCPQRRSGGTAMVPSPHIYHSRVMINAQGLRFVSQEIEICTCASALLNKSGPLALDAGNAHVGLADAHADQEQ